METLYFAFSQGEPGVPGLRGEPGLPGSSVYIPARPDTQYLRPVSLFPNSRWVVIVIGPVLSKY